MWTKILNWFKNLFTGWYVKEQFNASDVKNALDTLMSYVDQDKNGKFSIRDIVKIFKDLMKK